VRGEERLQILIEKAEETLGRPKAGMRIILNSF
jgi:hypothetical protein